jgi:hypothetical protein
LQKPLSTETSVVSGRFAVIDTTAGMIGRDIRNLLQAITRDVYLAKLLVDSHTAVSIHLY